MTVYDLIQELTRYNADTEVRFHFRGNFDVDVEAEFDRESEYDVQDITVNADFDGDVDFDDIDNFENARYVTPHILFNLSY